MKRNALSGVIVAAALVAAFAAGRTVDLAGRTAALATTAKMQADATKLLATLGERERQLVMREVAVSVLMRAALGAKVDVEVVELDACPYNADGSPKTPQPAIPAEAPEWFELQRLEPIPAEPEEPTPADSEPSTFEPLFRELPLDRSEAI